MYCSTTLAVLLPLTDCRNLSFHNYFMMVVAVKLSQLQLQLQSYTLQRIVLRGIMQCYRLVGKDGFSALIGTVGDC